MSALQVRSLLVSLLATVVLVLLSLHLWQALSRPLWMDETMAMTNYPLSRMADWFKPLPLYAQAAPPFFSAFVSAIADLPPFYGRLLTLAAILPAVLGAVFWAYRSMRVCAIALAGFLLLAISIPITTEFKYYGFEILSISIAISWMLRKEPGTPLQITDAALLLLAVVLGISSIIFVPIAIGVILILRWTKKFEITVKEISIISSFVVFLFVYYLIIKHVSIIQMDNYADIYRLNGFSALVKLEKHFINVAGLASAPLVAVSLLITLVTYKAATSKKLIIYAALTFLAFAALTFIGLFPAVHTRHVAWAAGLYLFILCNAAFIVMGSDGTLAAAHRRAFVVMAGIAALVALAASARLLTRPHLYVWASNDKAISDLIAQREHKVGLWLGAQPAIDFYRRLYPELDSREYFGRVNAERAPIATRIRSTGCTKEAYAALSAEFSARQDMTGAWGPELFYSVCKNHQAQADALIGKAPRGEPFLIFASHSWIAPEHEAQNPSITALFDALERNHCTRETVSWGYKYFILRATCP